MILIPKRSMVKNKRMRTQRNMKWTTVKLRTPVIPKVKKNKILITQAPSQMNQKKSKK